MEKLEFYPILNWGSEPKTLFLCYPHFFWCEQECLESIVKIFLSILLQQLSLQWEL